jgi:hypothetical protein
VHAFNEFHQRWVIRFAGPGQWAHKRYDESGWELDTDFMMGVGGGGDIDAVLDWMDEMA